MVVFVLNKWILTLNIELFNLNYLEHITVLFSNLKHFVMAEVSPYCIF